MDDGGAPGELPPSLPPTDSHAFPPPPPTPLTLNINHLNASAASGAQDLDASIPPTPIASVPQLDEVDAEGTASEHDESDSEGEDAPPQSSRWYPIQEDTAVAEGDELEYIEKSGRDHSALDEEYWEQTTFTALNDPEMVISGQGKIDFLVEKWNGTVENPRTELVIFSDTVNIGGLDWRMKIYPRGHDCEYISVYLECVSMRSPKWFDFEEFEDPAFPYLKGEEPLRKRRSLAVQFSVVMYNPTEPRVYEYQIEYHQYHHESADIGWKYFSRQPHRSFHRRQHLERCSILRDDKIAFRAYIRCVQDPTRCLWENTHRKPRETINITGLRPFSKSLQYMAAAVPLLYFRPFRELVVKMASSTRINLEDEGATARSWLQVLLLKLYTREVGDNWDREDESHLIGNVMEAMWQIRTQLLSEITDDPDLLEEFQTQFGLHGSAFGSASGPDRLNTKEHESIQDAVNHHPAALDCTKLLTLELQRHEHDKKTRKWKRLMNKVEVSDRLVVSGTSYTLLAFITHTGHLESRRYNWYVRPRGPGNLWSGYHDGLVTTLTETKVRAKYSGAEQDDGSPHVANGYDSPLDGVSEPLGEVTCAVIYVRDDVARHTFNFPDLEQWDYITDARHNRSAMEIESDSTEAAKQRAYMSNLARADTPVPSPARLPKPTHEGDDIVMKDVETTGEDNIEVPRSKPRDWMGSEYYEGHWNEEGQYHGGGHLIKLNGDEYLGEFEDGVFSGWGKMTYSFSGDTYEGSWRKGVPHGKGKLVEKSHGNVYEGSWEEGRKTGEFVLKGTVTEEQRALCRICYSEEINTAFYTCGHVVTCYSCANREDICPVCRRPIVARLQLYGVRLQSDQEF